MVQRGLVAASFGWIRGLEAAIHAAILPLIHMKAWSVDYRAHGKYSLDERRRCRHMLSRSTYRDVRSV